MKKSKLVSIAVACIICVSSTATCLLTASAEQQTTNNKVKIMALGDSITDGYWTGGGYRKYLCHELKQKGYSNIDMVGPKGGNTESFNYNGVLPSFQSVWRHPVHLSSRFPASGPWWEGAGLFH